MYGYVKKADLDRGVYQSIRPCRRIKDGKYGCPETQGGELIYYDEFFPLPIYYQYDELLKTKE